MSSIFAFLILTIKRENHRLRTRIKNHRLIRLLIIMLELQDRRRSQANLQTDGRHHDFETVLSGCHD